MPRSAPSHSEARVYCPRSTWMGRRLLLSISSGPWSTRAFRMAGDVEGRTRGSLPGSRSGARGCGARQRPEPPARLAHPEARREAAHDVVQDLARRGGVAHDQIFGVTVVQLDPVHILTIDRPVGVRLLERFGETTHAEEREGEEVPSPPTGERVLVLGERREPSPRVLQPARVVHVDAFGEPALDVRELRIRRRPRGTAREAGPPTRAPSRSRRVRPLPA